MATLQQVFDRIKETQHKSKEISKMYRDALSNYSKHKEIEEKFKALRERKKSIENEVKAGMSADLDRLERYKEDIKSDKEMLSDIAITNLMKGQTVQVTDGESIEYEPVFSVNFKKAD